MARKKTEAKKQGFIIRSLTLTQAADATLERLCSDGSDYSGWIVSKSAIVRAVLAFAGQQSDTWVLAHIFPLVEQEIAAGVVWGKKKSLRQ